MKIILTFLISLAFFTSVAAQQAQVPLDSLKSGFLTKSFLYEVLTHAKEHGVIVAFPTYSEKFEKLSKFTGTNADAERRRTEETKLGMHEALEKAAKKFEFAELRFIPDTLMAAYYEGVQQPYFMDQYGELRNGEIFENNLVIYPVSDLDIYLKINDLLFYNPDLRDILKTHWYTSPGLGRNNWLLKLLSLRPPNHPIVGLVGAIDHYLKKKYKRLDRRYNK